MYQTVNAVGRYVFDLCVRLKLWQPVLFHDAVDFDENQKQIFLAAF